MSAAWTSENVPRFVQTKLRQSWITAATLEAGVETWKRVTSFASYFRRSF